YKRPEIGLPEQFSGPASSDASTIQADWWTLYGDPTLNELVASAHANNADLRFAAAQVLEAEAIMRQARAALFPEVTGQFTRTRSRIGTLTQPPPVTTAPLERNDARLVASTSFEIDFWGRFGRADEAARAGLLGSQLAREVVGLTIGGITAQTYFGLRSLDAQIVALDNTIRLRRESLDIAQARAKAGLTSDLDVYQAQGALSDSLVQRPDIRAVEQTMIAANAQIGVARAARFPAVSLTAFLGGQSAAVEDIASSGIWGLGLGIVGPLFDAGRRAAVEDQQAARYQQTVAQWQRSVEGAFREVSDALVNLEETGNSEAELRARVEAARNALELSRIRYESGYSPYLEVLDAQRTANDAEIAFVRNRQARLAFSVDLMRA